jgi:hypothetical protein
MDKNGKLLARAGVILLLCSLVSGFLIHMLALQHQALAAHMAGLIGSSILFGLSCLWSHLRLSPGMSSAGVMFAVYGFFVGWLLNLLAAVTGIFGIFPLSVGISEGDPLANGLFSVGLLSVALADLALCWVVFQGLRE